MNQAQSLCFHCGLPVPRQTDLQLRIEQQQRHFCCPGCLAVAAAIVDGGLSSFYKFRTDNSNRPRTSEEDFSIFDSPEVQAEFVHQGEDATAEVDLLLEGITCAACVWLIEHQLGGIDGVESVRVNATTHRCKLRWQSQRTRLSDLMTALKKIGYHPVPATEGRQQALRERENRQALMRLAVAGFGMMQVGMVAVALYAGADAGWDVYLRWLSLVIATPVVVYSAAPFFGAARRALLSRHLSMDVPVAIAIGSAWLASVWATVFGGGEVYFDSVSMFTFFLLLGRYLEMRARHRNGVATDRLTQLLPLCAQRLQGAGRWESVMLRQLQVGDTILVASGACIPSDGVVVDGSSGVVETLMSGEADAVPKQVGDTVIAGTMNTDSALQIEVTAVGSGTRLSAIERLVEQAMLEKPGQVALADRLASWFVAAVLAIAVVVALIWWQLDPSRAFWVTLSVLVVTCPCALSLASPTALTVAISWLRRRGLLVTRGHVLEGLTRVDRVIFDKTGTLTLGCPQVVEVLDADGHALAQARRQSLLQLCAALESGSSHPIARAFAPWGGACRAESVTQTTGRGVRGRIRDPAGEGWFRLGKPSFAAGDARPPATAGQWLLLAQELEVGGVAPLAWIRLQDSLRPSAAALIRDLQQLGMEPELLSGDAEAEVARVARELGLRQWRANQSPDAKLAYIHALQSQDRRVMMVGDGINDVPVLSGAFISVAMGDASDLAQTRADAVLLNGDLSALGAAFACARLTRRVIRQNLGWAVTYNLLAVPLAACGWVPPWAAAIGMSASSLVVVGNALRIGRR